MSVAPSTKLAAEAAERAHIERELVDELQPMGTHDQLVDQPAKMLAIDTEMGQRLVVGANAPHVLQPVFGRLVREALGAIFQHARGRRLWVATTNLDAGRRVIWNMGAIAAHGEQGVRLFRDVLLASSAIPGFFSPVPIEVEANGKKFQELHGDGTLTAPFFVMPETMLSARSTSRPPLSQLYVMVNSKLGPEFKMPDRNIPGVLGRSIGVALTAALRAELMLIYAGAQRHAIAMRIAHVDPSFDFPSRGPFDGKYMQALYEIGVAAGKKGSAFGDTLPELSMHGSSSQQ